MNKDEVNLTNSEVVEMTGCLIDDEDNEDDDNNEDEDDENEDDDNNIYDDDDNNDMENTFENSSSRSSVNCDYFDKIIHHHQPLDQLMKMI